MLENSEGLKKYEHHYFTNIYPNNLANSKFVDLSFSPDGEFMVTTTKCGMVKGKV